MPMGAHVPLSWLKMPIAFVIHWRVELTSVLEMHKIITRTSRNYLSCYKTGSMVIPNPPFQRRREGKRR